MAKQPQPPESVRIDVGGEPTATNIGSAPRITQIAPTQAVEEVTIAVPSKPRTLTGAIFKTLFFAHLVGLGLLVSFLAIRGLLDKNPAFRPLHYFVPILASVVLSALLALLSLLFTLRHPSKSLNTSLWLSPVLTSLAGALLLVYGSAVSFAFGIPAIVFAVSQSFYSCWIGPRLQYARQILSVSIPTVKLSFSVAKYVALALVVACVYSWFWALGVGALAAAKDRRFDAIYVLLLLLSLAWTMEVIRNCVHVAVSHMAYTQLARGAGIPARDAFRGSSGRALGDICVGSALAPIVGLIRSTAHGMDLISGDAEECMFSCTSCYLGVADYLIVRANRWGFVHVGAWGMSFSDASSEAWGTFVQRRMQRVIDSDITSSFCFFCGVAGGSVAALACGSWMLAVDAGYATGPTVYAFIVGYSMVRIGMVWAEACVSAYYVACGEEAEENGRLGGVVADRIRELNSE